MNKPVAGQSPGTQGTGGQPTEVLAGSIERVTFHNAENGFCVLRIKARGHRDLVTVVGHAAEISAGEWVTVSGTWINSREHGQQFKASFLKASAPTTAEGIEKYLGSGMIRGIGPVQSQRINQPAQQPRRLPGLIPPHQARERPARKSTADRSGQAGRKPNEQPSAAHHFLTGNHQGPPVWEVAEVLPGDSQHLLVAEAAVVKSLNPHDPLHQVATVGFEVVQQHLTHVAFPRTVAEQQQGIGVGYRLGDACQVVGVDRSALTRLIPVMAVGEVLIRSPDPVRTKHRMLHLVSFEPERISAAMV
jgi:hypothetical protein